MKIEIVESIQQSLKEKIQQSDDVVYKELHSKTGVMKLFYIKTLSDETQIGTLIIKPFYEMANSESFSVFLRSNPKVKLFDGEEKAVDDVTKGIVLLFFQQSIFLVDLKTDRNNSVLDTTVETTIQGPQSGFSESLATNLGLIRQRYPTPSLKIDAMEIGSISRTQVMTLYDTRNVNQDVLDNVRQFLNSIEIEMFQSGEQLLDLVKKKKRSLFPIMLITERADRVAVNLAAGKVILLVSGSPFAVVLPTVLKDFMASMEDIYQTFWVTQFLLILRYCGLLISLILPASYIALTAYNPEIFRIQLALSIAGSRTTVPYPSFIEVFVMFLFMELLTEASIRLPKAIGPTATTVGGLILGQAATEAGLVSNIMIIIVSAVGISNFVIPINAFSFSLRVAKYFLVVLAIFYGIVGIVIGFFLLIAYMVSLDSFGQPFFTLTDHKPAKSSSQ